MTDREKFDYDGEGWPRLAQALRASGVDSDDIGLLVRHLTDRLVGHFGAESVEVWRAKEGLHRHPMSEAAAVVVLELAPLLARLDPDTIGQLRVEGDIGAELSFPWEDRW